MIYFTGTALYLVIGIIYSFLFLNMDSSNERFVAGIIIWPYKLFMTILRKNLAIMFFCGRVVKEVFLEIASDFRPSNKS